MKKMRLQDKFSEIRKAGKALLAFNFYNYETLRAVLEAAKSSSSPLILQLTKSSIDDMGLENAVAMGRAGLSYFGVEGWIHLDHGGSIELVEQCLKAGFDSVMFDGSELPFEDNVALISKYPPSIPKNSRCGDSLSRFKLNFLINQFAIPLS